MNKFLLYLLFIANSLFGQFCYNPSIGSQASSSINFSGSCVSSANIIQATVINAPNSSSVSIRISRINGAGFASSGSTYIVLNTPCGTQLASGTYTSGNLNATITFTPSISSSGSITIMATTVSTTGARTHSGLITITNNSNNYNVYEPNNSSSGSSSTLFSGAILSNSSNSTLINSYLTSGDQDWYSVGVSGTGSLKVDLTSLPADYDIELYPLNGLAGGKINQSYNSGTSNESFTHIFTALQSTVVYIKVYPKAPETNNYSYCDSYTLSCTWTPSCINPNTPTGLNATSVSSSQINLSWNSVSGVIGYDVYNCDGSYVQFVPAPSTNLPITGLNPATTYSYKILAQKNQNCLSNFTVCASATTQPTCVKPSIPSGFTATAISSSQINLSWNAVGGTIEGYNIYKCDDTFIAFTTNTFYTDQNLNASTQYSYKIRAQKTANCLSDLTSCASATTQPNINCTTCPSYDVPIDPTINWQTHSSSIQSSCWKLYRIQPIAGNTYTFKTGCSDGATANFDTELFLYDANCNLIAYDDNNCGLQSRIIWTATNSNNVYLKVKGVTSSSGNYTLAYSYCNQNILPTTFTASNTNIYSGNTTTLTSNTCAGCTYEWKVVSNNGVILTNPTNYPEYTVQLFTPGYYTVIEKISTSPTCFTTITKSAFITVNGQNNVPGSTPPQQTQYYTYIDIRYPKPVAADPVNLISGLQEDVFDLIKLPVINGSLNFSVFYNGAELNYTDAFMGRGRRHSFDYRLINENDDVWKVRYPDLHETQFVPLNNNGNIKVNSFPLTKGIFEKLVRDPNNGEFTLTFKNQVKLIFAGSGQLLRILDRNNNQATLTHQNGKLISVTGPGGRGLNLSYTNELLTTVSTFTGESVSFDYVNNNLTTLTDLEGKTYTYNYNVNNTLDWVKKPNGNYLLRNEYNVDSKIIRQLDGEGYPTEFIYDPANRKTTLRYLNGSTRIYEYDALYRVIRETDEDNKVEITEYDDNNVPTKHIDKNSIAVNFKADTTGNITDEFYPLGKQVHRKFNEKNDLIYTTEVPGDTVKFLYNTAGNPIKTIFEDGTTNEVNVNSQGQVIARRDGKRIIVDTLVYNLYGDIIKSINPYGEYINSVDNFGRVISTLDPVGNRDSTYYNKLGQKIRHINSNGKEESWGYDFNHNEITHTDFKGNQYNKLYDSNDQVIEENGPLLFKNRYKRNFRGFVEKSYNSLNDSTTNVFSNIGHLKESSLNNLPPTKNTIDNEGNVLSTTDPLGKIITNNLDSLYRNTKIDFNGIYDNRTEFDIKNNPIKLFDGLGNFKSINYNKRKSITSLFDELNNPINITYDANQKSTQIVDAEGNINLNGYDLLSRPVTNTDGSNNITGNVYNADGTVSRLNNPDNSFVDITYTNTKQVNTISHSGGQNYSFGYDDNDNNTSIGGPHGQESFTYNALNQKTSYTDVFGKTIGFVKNAIGLNTKVIYPGNKEILIHNNAFNLPDTITIWNGKKIINNYNIASYLTSKLFPNSIVQNISRDAIYRVNQYNYKKQSDTLYNYWCNRNLVSDIDTFNISGPGLLIPQIKEQNKGYQYQGNDAIASDSISNYVSNAKGAVTDRKTLSNQPIDHYEYIENNLLSVFNNINFKWNGLEKLIEINRNSIKERLVQDCSDGIAKLLMTTKDDGTPTGYYIYDHLGPVAFIDEFGNNRYYHFDIQGNTAFLTDDSGAITDKYSYDIHGTLLEHQGNSKQLLCTFGQHGAIMITDSLVCIQSRMLSTTTGRFLSKDRANFDFRDPFTLNKYVYANNNPVGYYDVTGWGVEQSTFNKTIRIACPADFNNNLFKEDFWGYSKAILNTNVEKAGNAFQKFVSDPVINSISFPFEMTAASLDFAKNYFDMRYVNFQNSDKYFHAKANFEATHRGNGGKFFAEHFSNLREIWDQNIKGYPLSDSILDQKANLFGRMQSNFYAPEYYKDALKIYRPELLPTKY